MSYIYISNSKSLLYSVNLILCPGSVEDYSDGFTLNLNLLLMIITKTVVKDGQIKAHWDA